MYSPQTASPSHSLWIPRGNHMSVPYVCESVPVLKMVHLGHILDSTGTWYHMVFVLLFLTSLSLIISSGTWENLDSQLCLEIPALAPTWLESAVADWFGGSCLLQFCPWHSLLSYTQCVSWLMSPPWSLQSSLPLRFGYECFPSTSLMSEHFKSWQNSSRIFHCFQSVSARAVQGPYDALGSENLLRGISVVV